MYESSFEIENWGPSTYDWKATAILETHFLTVTIRKQEHYMPKINIPSKSIKLPLSPRKPKAFWYLNMVNIAEKSLLDYGEYFSLQI